MLTACKCEKCLFFFKACLFFYVDFNPFYVIYSLFIFNFLGCLFLCLQLCKHYCTTQNMQSKLPRHLLLFLTNTLKPQVWWFRSNITLWMSCKVFLSIRICCLFTPGIDIHLRWADQKWIDETWHLHLVITNIIGGMVLFLQFCYQILNFIFWRVFKFYLKCYL